MGFHPTLGLEPPLSRRGFFWGAVNEGLERAFFPEAPAPVWHISTYVDRRQVCLEAARKYSDKKNKAKNQISGGYPRI